MTNWKKPEHSRSQIINAGKVIKTQIYNNEYKHALEIIDNWRASHAYPLQVIYCHLKRKYTNETNYIVAQRLKRLSSIEKKLQRESSMNLWTMQDLGGCRLIVQNISDVYNAINAYKKSRIRHILKREYDYIQNPKKSGYRSYHMVYQFQSDKKETFNKNILIEIQIRTYLQHLWATAVETIGLFTKQSLKSSSGSKDTLRFLTLISSLFALKEAMPQIPDTPLDQNKLIAELNSLEKKHNYFGMLNAFRVVVEKHDESTNREKGYYLLELNYKSRKLRMSFFKPSQIETANALYHKLEQNPPDTTDIVLVSVSSFKTLRLAYPNYFYDIKEFISQSKKIIEEYSH